jgi:hypothetical protein
MKILIVELATWLRNQARVAAVPGGETIAKEFHTFQTKIPQYCAIRGLQENELTFGDYADLVAEYLTMTA